MKKFLLRASWWVDSGRERSDDCIAKKKWIIKVEKVDDERGASTETLAEQRAGTNVKSKFEPEASVLLFLNI